MVYACRTMRLLGPGALVIGLILAACSGGSGEPTVIPRVTSVVAERDIAEGLALTSTTVRVEYDRALRQAGGPIPLASRFEFSAPTYGVDGRLEDERVIVQSAAVVEERVVELKVARLLPAGATLTALDAAWDTRAEGSSVVDVESALTPEVVLLASTAFQTTDPSLFDESGREPAGADDPATVRAALEAHLDLRGAGPEVRAAALDVYDSRATTIVPDPKLRAALAALTGTFAEPAVGALLTGDNCTGLPAARIAFEPPPDAPDLIARVSFDAQGRRILSVAPLAQGERFEHLMPLLVHEPIHCDQRDGIFEEVAATAFDTFLYLNLISVDPTLAVGGSPLTRELAVDAVAFINSGRLVPESGGVLGSAGVANVLPGASVAFPSFGEFVASAYAAIDVLESPDEALAQAYVEILAGGVLPTGPAFDLVYLDALLSSVLEPAVVVAAIDALQLVPAG